MHALQLQSCLTLCDLMDCSQPPLSIGFSKARILDWVAMPSSRESFQPRDRTYILYLHINRCLVLRLPEETSIKHFTALFFKNFWLHHKVCGILVPQPWIERTPPALQGRLFTTVPPGKCTFCVVI